MLSIEMLSFELATVKEAMLVLELTIKLWLDWFLNLTDFPFL